MNWSTYGWIHSPFSFFAIFLLQYHVVLQFDFDPVAEFICAWQSSSDNDNNYCDHS